MHLLQKLTPACLSIWLSTKSDSFVNSSQTISFACSVIRFCHPLECIEGKSLGRSKQVFFHHLQKETIAKLQKCSPGRKNDKLGLPSFSSQYFRLLARLQCLRAVASINDFISVLSRTPVLPYASKGTFASMLESTFRITWDV